MIKRSANRICHCAHLDHMILEIGPATLGGSWALDEEQTHTKRRDEHYR